MNPAFIALGAANPGLLPLAFSTDASGQAVGGSDIHPCDHPLIQVLGMMVVFLLLLNAYLIMPAPIGG